MQGNKKIEDPIRDFKDLGFSVSPNHVFKGETFWQRFISLLKFWFYKGKLIEKEAHWSRQPRKFHKEFGNGKLVVYVYEQNNKKGTYRGDFILVYEETDKEPHKILSGNKTTTEKSSVKQSIREFRFKTILG